MSCNQIPNTVSALLDGSTADAALLHMEDCRECGSAYASARSLRADMRAMARPAMPQGLNGKLRVMASHAARRQAVRVTPAARWRDAMSAARLWFDNLMRPVALPFAGGLLSALLMFGTIFPRMAVRYSMFTDAEDIPTILSTQPEGEVQNWQTPNRNNYYPPLLMPVDSTIDPDATVVRLTIDPEGKVADFSLEQGVFTDEALSVVMMSQFSPATNFGKPIWGQTLLVIRHPTTYMRG